MAWTNAQKQIAARACQAAGLGDEGRRMILHNIDNARLDGGKVSSTSPKLTNADFEQFMAIVERAAGGKVLHFTEGYWATCAANALGRMRHRAATVAELLEKAGQLEANGVGLAGWISKRVARGEANRMEELDYQGMRALIFGLESFARQRGVCMPA